jgi:hypothetical protein
MSGELNRRNVRQFRAPHYVSAICEQAAVLAGFDGEGLARTCVHRHCERSEDSGLPPRKDSGLLTWGSVVSIRLVSSLFDCRPALRPDRETMEMARGAQVKVGP